jgi:hypothetical protein
MRKEEGSAQRAGCRANEEKEFMRKKYTTNKNPGRLVNVLRLLTAHCSLLTALVLFTAHCSLLTGAAQAQQVVDKMVATVNASGQTRCQVCLITYSDLLWQMALQPGTVLVNPSSDVLNRTLSLIVDQRLILQEAEKLPSIAPTTEEIAAARDELAKAFPSQAEFQSRLQSVGLTAEKLNEIIEQRVKIEKYLDFRFRNFVVITQNEIADYYRDVYVPRLRSRAPGQILPTLEQATPVIEKTLTEAKIETDTDAFLDNARERAEIVTLSPV